MGFTFRKEERLSKRKQIQELFAKGSSFYLYPFKLILLPAPKSALHQILISVPARNFKRAVDRNLLKRRIREAYRLQKGILPEQKMFVGFIYTAKEILSFQDIKQKMLSAFAKINTLPDRSNVTISKPKKGS
jgi:ribonuclease P protein component